MEAITKKPHAVALVSPGMGHLTPVVELVKRLVTHHGFEVTLFAVIIDSSTIQSQILSSTSTIPNSNLLHIRVIQVDQVLPDTDLVGRIVASMDKAIPLVRSAIACMKPCPDLFIADLFGMGFWGVGDEFEMPKYVFMTTSAWFLALTVYLPVFEMEVGREKLQGLDCVPVPGCNPVKRKDSPESFDRDHPGYTWFAGVAKKISASDGIIVNSWHDLEPKAIRSLNDRHLKGRVFPVGPLVKQPSLGEEVAPVFNWMDKQPDESVLYVSFGSGGSLTCEQTQELAWGLEFSKQRFIWVLRPPLDKDASEFFFSVDIGGGHRGGLDYLPTGFLARTEDVGLVIPMWAPQTEILGHKSVGGFLTHCGWNSVSESVVNGVPMLAWPLYAEQELNATMLTEDLKIAVRPEASSSSGKDRVIGREEIEKAIRKIMVDKSSSVIRKRVKKLKRGAVKAGQVGKGSSYNSLSEFTKLCTLNMKSNK